MLRLAVALLLLAPQDNKEVESKLKNIKISLDFKNAPLETVVDYVRELSGLNVLIDKSAREKGEIVISLTVKEVSLKSALQLMLKPQGLDTMFEEGVLLIVSKEKTQEKVFTEIYDVRDLLFPIKDFPGVDFSLAPDNFGGVTASDDSGTPVEIPIEEIVKAHTGGKTWDENPKASVSLQNGLLVVKQTKEVHQQIKRLIGKLRQFK